MAKTIVFIHGMFQNAKSWSKWVSYFESKGYHCIAESWPDHEGEPSVLRENPPADLGDLRLETVISKFENLVSGLPERPIVIGHSVGGLITQILVNKQLASFGVPISSVAPNAMLSIDWNFFKNAVTITNPFKGDQPMFQDVKGFHEAFCNTLDESAAQAAFDETATHDSRNVLRDCMMAPGHVDLELPHVPLFFVAGEKDHIIPEKLVEKNSKAYKDEASISDFREYPNRSHYICGEPGWEEVAADIYGWLQKQHVEEDAAVTY